MQSGIRISDGWYCRFLNRQTKPYQHKTDAIGNVHMKNKEELDNYFKL